MDFGTKLRRAATKNRSWLCVGIDPAKEKMPVGLPKTTAGLVRFCTEIIRATAPDVAAFKPNIAFFEALGADAFVALRDVLDSVPADIPVILDAKRGDIGNTAERYAECYFDHLGVDAVTVNPYMGWDAVRPFAERPDRAAFVLCLTSNESASQVQMLPVGSKPLFLRIARMVAAWPGTCGLVVGATRAPLLEQVRQAAPEPIILIPGVGAQGGDLETSVRLGSWPNGGGALVTASRSVLYASRRADYGEAAAKVARTLRERIARAEPSSDEPTAMADNSR